MEKQIVFLEGTPNYMCFKIAKVLRDKGYKTILIALRGKFDKTFYEGYDKIISFNLEHLNVFKHPLSTFKNLFYNLRIFKIIKSIKELNPYIIMGVTAPYPILFSAIVMKVFKKYPFIYFPYDVNLLKYHDITNNYKIDKIPKIEVKAEKCCLKNADGLIFKGNEFKIIKNMIKTTSPVLQFLPYCLKDYIVPINKNKISKKDNEIHIVYIGTFSDDLLEGLYNILEQKVHLHAYTGQYNLIKDSLKYRKFINNKYFHLHKPVEQSKLAKEISKYDFGCWFSDLDFNLWKKEWVTAATGNKIATHIEAGIPLLIYDNMEFNNYLIKKYGIGLGINKSQIKDLKSILKSFNNKKFIKKVAIARKEFEMSYNIPKLERFFEEVRNAKGFNN